MEVALWQTKPLCTLNYMWRRASPAKSSDILAPVYLYRIAASELTYSAANPLMYKADRGSLLQRREGYISSAPVALR